MTEPLRQHDWRWVTDNAAAAADLIGRLKAENERLRAELRRILNHYEARSELYTNDADLSAGMASIAQVAIGETE